MYVKNTTAILDSMWTGFTHIIHCLAQQNLVTLSQTLLAGNRGCSKNLNAWAPFRGRGTTPKILHLSMSPCGTQ